MLTQQRRRQHLKLVHSPPVSDDERFKAKTMRLATRRQEIRKMHPAFAELVDDHRVTNSELESFALQINGGGIQWRR